MSAGVVTALFDTDRITLLTSRGVVIGEVRWAREQADDAFARVGALMPPSSDTVLVVGAGLLEVAKPDLPPLAPTARLALLRRDADRYFPVTEAVAVSATGAYASAIPAERLRAWVDALGAFCHVRATATVFECLARADADGRFAVGSEAREMTRVTYRQGVLQQVERAALPATGEPATPPPVSTPTIATNESRDADGRPLIARGAQHLVTASLDALLLDAGLERRFGGARRRRWLLSVAALVLAISALGWAADRWRTRLWQATEQQIAARRSAAAPAQDAMRRARRAERELALLTTAEQAPGAVLAVLTQRLPSDAFVQRLEWDGAQWRIDGSALNAPRIVSALDADSAFRDVRIMGASTRFLDGGRQRESFSVAFRLRQGAARVQR
jgi:hypothetical protein